MTYIYASKFRRYKHITYIIHLYVFNVLFYNVKHHIWVEKLSYIDFLYFQVKKLNTLEVTDIWKKNVSEMKFFLHQVEEHKKLG